MARSYLIQDSAMKDIKRSLKNTLEFFETAVKEVEIQNRNVLNNKISEVDYAQAVYTPEHYYNFRFKEKYVQIWNVTTLRKDIIKENSRFLYSLYCVGFIPSAIQHKNSDYYKYSETDYKFCLYGSFTDFHTVVQKYCDIVNELTAIQSKGLF